MNAHKNKYNIFLITLIAALMATISFNIESWLYPIKYEDQIEKYASEYNVEKELIISVMKVESRFNEHALSESGAIGLMQLMPETGEWIADHLDEEVGDLFEIDKNIKYGVWYLAFLTKEFGGNKVLALAAYNAGHAAVWDWIDDFGWSKDFDDVEAIPYPETRQYVKRVLKNYQKYKQIFNSVSS